MQLDPRHRFDSFVVGASNRLAAAAARAVTHSPGVAYNPLFVYGGSGLGKTHLLSAIGQQVTERHPGMRVSYVTMEEFMELLHVAIGRGALDEFKERYERADVLLLDDVQFMAGRRETQAEMLRLFDVLQRAGRQVVLASDRPPAEIAGLDERLTTRFAGGLVVDMSSPDFETRVAILRRKCAEREAEFAPGVVEELARLEYQNVREMQGALNKLIACQTLGQEDVRPMNVRALLGEPPIVPDQDDSDEFASFLFGLHQAVSDQLEPWKARLNEAITYWHQLGFRTTALERELERDSATDPDLVIRGFQTDVERLRTLAREASALDPTFEPDDRFRDPEMLPEAERLVAELLGDAEPLPAPSPEFGRAEYESGSSNQLAVHAADAAIEAPGVAYNPLFLHGPRGAGKTHLLHAIGNELVMLSGGAMRVACLGGGRFVHELITALEAGTIERWRTRYRLVDALLLDDVQECAGTERTQEELFNLFNALHAAGRQIVIAADRPPRALTGLEERLRSRFDGGLVVPLKPPDRELRGRLYARYLSASGIDADQEVLAYLSGRAAAGVRDVISAVRVLSQSLGARGGRLSVVYARRVLEGSTASLPSFTAVNRVADPSFLDVERIVWRWPDVSGRAIEEFR